MDENKTELSDVMYALDMAKERLTEFYTQEPDDFLNQWARNTVRAISAQQDKIRA